MGVTAKYTCAPTMSRTSLLRLAAKPLRVRGNPRRSPGDSTKPPHGHAHAPGATDTNSSASTRVAWTPGRLIRFDTSVWPAAGRALDDGLPDPLDEAPLAGSDDPDVPCVVVA